MNQFVDLLILSSNLICGKAFKKTKTKQNKKTPQKTTSSVLKTTDLPLFYQSVGKF